MSESGDAYDSEARCQRCGDFADGNARIAFAKELSHSEVMIEITILALCSKCHRELKALERNADLLEKLVSV